MWDKVLRHLFFYYLFGLLSLMKKGEIASHFMWFGILIVLSGYVLFSSMGHKLSNFERGIPLKKFAVKSLYQSRVMQLI